MNENDIISKTLLTVDKFKSFPQFKQAIIDNNYTPQTPYFIRSLIWKTIFITENLNIQSWQVTLNNSRRVYHELIKQDDMNIPWFKLDKESDYYQSFEISRSNSLRRKSSKKVNLKKPKFTRALNDPLSEDLTNDMNNLSIDKTGAGTGEVLSNADDDEESLELLRIITLDIDRIFPGEMFFNSINHKRQLIEVLYVWSKCNPKIGYKQGFHEIIGLIFKNLFHDIVSLPKTNNISTDDLKVLNLYDVKYLSHDTFIIFNKFMNNYGIIHNYYESEKFLIHQIENFNKYLIKIDQLIHYTLISKLKLESQLWCIRYLRLIFLREFGNLDNISLLWDKLITVEPTQFPNLLILIMVIMLINLKSDLIICDFSECLSLLLHYPTASLDSDFFKILFKYSMELLNSKDNDLKLYELGLKINEKFNPDLKISLSFNGKTSVDSLSRRSSTSSSPLKRDQTPSRTNSSKSSTTSISNGTTNGADIGAGNSNNLNPTTQKEKMAFEKYRLEMRLKKKAQLLMRS